MPQTSTSSTDAKLDEIIAILNHMNRRDRLRTIGGFFRFLITMIPLVLVLWSSWYFYTHSDEVLKKITEMSASAAAGMTKNVGGNLEEMMRKYGR